MKKIVVYDHSGKIIGVVVMTDGKQADNYPNRIDIDDEDFSSKPHLWAEVDVEKKSLHPKPGESDPTGKGRKSKATP